MTTQVNNLTNNTMIVVKSTKKDFIEAMNTKENTKLSLCNRTDNGWYILEINGVKMILEINENN